MRRHPLHIIIVVTILTVLISWGCSKKKAGEEEATPGASPPIAVPHPDGWSAPHSHGIWVNQNTFEACLACHKIESEQTETSPTCYSCHPLYPHTDGWDQKVNHGAYVGEHGQDGCATQCHGTDLGGGLSNVSCSSCHEVYPHAADWGDPSKHGKYVNDNGIATCKTACHGTDLGGGTSGVSCTSCHSLYPHPAGWEQVSGHGAYVITNGYGGCQTPCHGTDLQGGTSNISCASCHPDYPHTDPNWATGAGHGAFYSASYNSSSANDSCRVCHGAPVAFTDSTPITGLGVPNCVSCHFMQPSMRPATTQTKDVLKAQSECYSCHWAYPHLAYDLLGTISSAGMNDWRDPPTPEGIAHADYFINSRVTGHIWYVLRSPLLEDAGGVRPWSSFLGMDYVPALQHTCGGDTVGLCHDGGNRWSREVIFPLPQPPEPMHSPLCAGYCHKPPLTP